MKVIDDDGNVIAEGQTISLKPGDVLVFKTTRRLRDDESHYILEELERLLPGHKAVMIQEGGDLSVLRPATATAG